MNNGYSRQQDVLHCGPGGGSWGGSSPLPVDICVLPVHNYVTVCSGVHACLALGLFDSVMKKEKLSWNVLTGLAKKKWRGSVDKFWYDAEPLGHSREKADKLTGFPCAAAIGWVAAENQKVHDSRPGSAFCTDLSLVIGVLARRVGNLFLASRTADYSWDALFTAALSMDETMPSIITFKDAPFNRYRWENNRACI